MSQPDEILTILARDARTSADTIATLTGRDPAEVRATIAEYEQRGIIKHYKTIVDWEKAGESRRSSPLLMSKSCPPARSALMPSPSASTATRKCTASGSSPADSDLRVVVEGENMRAVGRFVAEKLSALEGVTATDTHFLLRRYKEDQDLFVETEEDQRLVVTP